MFQLQLCTNCPCIQDLCILPELRCLRFAAIHHFSLIVVILRNQMSIGLLVCGFTGFKIGASMTSSRVMFSNTVIARGRGPSEHTIKFDFWHRLFDCKRSPSTSLNLPKGLVLQSVTLLHTLMFCPTCSPGRTSEYSHAGLAPLSLHLLHHSRCATEMFRCLETAFRGINRCKSAM